MPAKNCPGKFGRKFLPLSRVFHKKFMQETGITIDYNTFRKIIVTNTQNIANSIINEPEGVQLPEQMGCIVVTKYKPFNKETPRATDYGNMIKTGKYVPFLNLHSFGYMYNIRWYKIGSRAKNIKLYYLYRCRPLKRGVAKSIKAGTNFFQWSDSDMWNLSKLERRFNKRFKKEEDDN